MNELRKSLNEMDEALSKIEHILNNTCHLCVNPIPEGSVKHKIDSSTICDDCWQRIKEVMDQEDR